MNAQTMQTITSSQRNGRGSDNWATPQGLFDALHAEFGFETDVCALPENAKCRRFFTTEQDGLKQDWAGVCWCNPPYSQLAVWIAKARISADAGATVVMLIPARTDTRAWHEHIFGNPFAQVRFIKGRIRFGSAPSGAPFPSAVVIFKKESP